MDDVLMLLAQLTMSAMTWQIAWSGWRWHIQHVTYWASVPAVIAVSVITFLLLAEAMPLGALATALAAIGWLVIVCQRYFQKHRRCP